MKYQIVVKPDSVDGVKEMLELFRLLDSWSIKYEVVEVKEN